jgi:hypothetical protein
LIDEARERWTTGDTTDSDQLAQRVDATVVAGPKGFCHQELLQHEDVAHADTKQHSAE